MDNKKIIENYYIGFLTNANDPLPTLSCYEENHLTIRTSSEPTKEDLAYLFNDNNVQENWIHIFKVTETLYDFSDSGFKSRKDSEYFISY